MNFATTNSLELIADQLKQKIFEVTCDVESSLNDVERELIEVRQRQDAIIERLNQIARRLGPFPIDENRCPCGTFPCSWGEH